VREYESTDCGRRRRPWKSTGEQYLQNGDDVSALVLRAAEMKEITHARLRVVEGNVTHPESILGVTDGQELVIPASGSRA